MRRRLDLLVSMGILALATAACTKTNPHYCADAGPTFNCSTLNHDAGLESPSDAGDAVGDAVPDAIDAHADTGPEIQPPVCVLDQDCAGADAGTPACGTSDGGAKCVECTMSTHCKGAKPVCDTSAEKCVECLGAAGSGMECTAVASKSVCNGATRSCVQCLDNSKCTGIKPICDLTQKSCRACTLDSECAGIGPGICVDYDGHCAATAEVVTVQGGAGCVASGSLYCRASDAVGVLSTHPILLVKGPDPVGTIEPPLGAAPKILIVGEGNAVVGAGSGDAAGIHLQGASRFWVRDLKISGGTVGVLADTGAELHLTRCVVTQNGKGGIKTIGSSFDITNTIIAANGAGTDTGGVVWGGARLGDIPQAGTARFENNTVVDNMLIGVSCKTPYDVSTDLIHNNVGGNIANCTGALCCGAGDPDPLLDASYHLMSTSPCIDKIIPTASSVTVDIQGQPRPTSPGRLDCGADEFMP
jgi:hypothetical protein